MKEIVIFGSGNHAKLIYNEILNLKSYKFLGFIAPLKKKITIDKKQINIYASIKKIKNKKIHAIIGIGNNFIREKVFKDACKLNSNIIWEKIISKKTYIGKNVKIGEGTFVAQGSNICSNSSIGKNCIINSASSIDHDNIFDDFSSTGPGMVTGGNVEVGLMCHIGIGSIVNNNVNIKKYIIIGGNSYVNKSCKKKGLYFGSPIKFQKKINRNFNYLK